MRILPQNQMKTMFSWFHESGIKTYDLHVRSPLYKGVPYHSKEWVWLTHNENMTLNEILNLVKWCRYKNLTGSDIFIRPHRRHPQPVIFLDDLPINVAYRILKKYRSLAVETSRNNTQVWLSVDRSLCESERKYAQQFLSNLGYSDRGSVSGEHLGRLCGVRSQKRLCWVNILSHSSGKMYSPSIEPHLSFPRRGACVNKITNIRSESETDFVEVLKRLRNGESILNAKIWLTQKSEMRGKRMPQQYSDRTIKNVLDLMKK